MPAASTAANADHRAAADGIIERARVIDQPRVSGKLRDSDYNSEEKKSREQCVTPNDCNPDEQAIIDYIKSGTRTPVRPRRERQQRNRDNVDEDGRDDNKQALAFEYGVPPVPERHNSAVASRAMGVNRVAASPF